MKKMLWITLILLMILGRTFIVGKPDIQVVEEDDLIDLFRYETDI